MENREIHYFNDETKNKWSSLSKKKILLINTQWNEKFVGSMTKKAIELFEHANVSYDVKTVPGAYELAYGCRKFADQYDGIVTIGVVIKGDTFHFEAIALAATLNISKVSIEQNVPISFGVITVNNLKQAEERTRDDETNKGLEAAAALLDLLVL